MNSDTLNVMRRVTWCRAKGELTSILEYYLSSRDGTQSQKDFDIMYNNIHEFIDWMENESPIS